MVTRAGSNEEAEHHQRASATEREQGKLLAVQRILVRIADFLQAAAARRQAIKDNRTARMEKHDLVRILLDHFKTHRIWGLRDLKAVVHQPEQFLREILSEIAFMHKQGDFNGKWELKKEYKANDDALLHPQNIEAPKMEESDVEVSGMEGDGDGDEDEDEDENFEDV